MHFIAAPLRITTSSGLQRFGGMPEAIVELLKIMVRTPADGWLGSEQFGMRDTLATLQTKSAAKLMAIKQVNQGLVDLGIDWVKVDNIEIDADRDTWQLPYVFTLTFRDQATQIVRFDVEKQN